MKIKDLLSPKPRWQHAEADVRREAIEDSKLAIEDLKTLVFDDPDQAVRTAALKKINSVSVLKDLNVPDDLCPTRIARLVELICAEDAAPGVFAEADSIKDVDILGEIAKCARQQDLSLSCLARISDDDVLAKLALQAHLSVARQAAVDKIQDEAKLEGIARDIKDKDKNVSRLVRQKLDEFKRERAARLELLSACEAVTNSLVTLAAVLAGDATHKYKLQELQAKWTLLAEGRKRRLMTSETAQLQTQYDIAHAKCLDAIQTAEAARARTLEAIDLCERLEARLVLLEHSNESLEALEESCRAAAAAWHALALSDPDVAERYHRCYEKLERINRAYSLLEQKADKLKAISSRLAEPQEREDLATELSSIHWPPNVKEPTLLLEARTALAGLDDAAKHADEQQRILDRKITEELANLHAAIEAGSLKAATKLHRAIDTCPPRSRKQQDDFSQLTKRLRELQDWQRFVTNPKRLHLCERIEELISSDQHPPHKATLIKSLQQEWKDLGPSNSPHSQKLWKRFKHAADLAYKPCAEFFAEQAALRKQNLEERKKICGYLETYNSGSGWGTDWNNTDWKSAAQIIYTARNEWRDYSNIRHRDKREIQKRFDRVIKDLQSKLDEEHSRNEADKRDLISRARLILAEEADLSSAINQAKSLQKGWNDTGITRHRIDQKLWKEFRSILDEIFGRRDAEQKKAKDQSEENSKRALEICHELEDMISQEDLSEASVTRLRKEFTGLALAKTEAASIHRRFDKVMKDCAQCLSRQSERAIYEILDLLKERVRLCETLEQSAELKQELQAPWEALDPLPETLQAKMDRRWQSALAHTGDEAQCKEAERLCVKLELLTGMESPPEADSLRLEIQVERLRAKHTLGREPSSGISDQYQDLLTEWYCIGALPAHVKQPLAHRIDAVRAKFEQQAQGR